MKPENVEKFYEKLLEMSVFFKDPMTEERQLLYWKAMRTRCSINEWFYACDKAMERETFHAVPLPATMMPYCLEYRTERRRALEIRQLDGRRLLTPAEEPSRDPSFAGTEAERKAWIAKRTAGLREQLEAKWAAAEAQGTITGPRPYTKRSPEELHYVPSEDSDTARARAMHLLDQLRREEEGGNAPLH